MEEVFVSIALLKKVIAIWGVGSILAEVIKIKAKKENERLATSVLEKGQNGNKEFVISKNYGISQKELYEGMCVVAPTGAGKTTNIFFPNLLRDRLKGSVIVLDPKLELYKKTAAYQKSIGREVLLFQPFGEAEQYNILEQCKTDTEVTQLAQTILYNSSLASEITTGKQSGGVEWLDMATPLLTAIFMYVKKIGCGSIENALKYIIESDYSELEEETGAIKMNYEIFKSVGSANRTLGSIKVTLTTALRLFTDSKLNKAIAATTFTPEQLRKKKTILYISYPENKSAYLSPYMASFFQQVLNVLIDTDGLPITILADETANIGLIPNFQTIVSTCRSRQVGWCTCIQGITQLQQLYGRYNTTTILNNLKTKVILGGLTDVDTLDYIEKIIGTMEIETKTENKNGDSKGKTTRPLLRKDEIRKLEGALIIKNKDNPILDVLEPYYSNAKYTDNIAEVKAYKKPLQKCKDIKTHKKKESDNKYIKELFS